MSETLNFQRLDPEMLAAILRDLGLHYTQTSVEHFQVLLECQRIRDERGEKYGENWKTYGWMDSLFHARSKFSRMTQLFWSGKNRHDRADLDTPADAINYLAFFIRNYLADNERGVEA